MATRTNTHTTRAALDAIWHEIELAAEAQEIGGGVMMVQHRGDVVLEGATGYAVREPESERTEMALDTIFDLASLTKVLSTTPAVLQLIEQNRLALDEPIGTWLPEFGTEGDKQGVTVRRLLSHTSGITGWRGVYTEGTGIDAYIASLARDQPAVTPGTQVEYSCMGFILLGEVVRRLSGVPLNEYAARHVFTPLGMVDTGYLPDPALRSRIAATEHGNYFEREATRNVPPVQGWREYLIRGEVHDGNAWYGLAGISGNAGLFGTAADLMRYANMWLNRGELDGVRLLGEGVVAEAMTEQTHLAAPNERRGLGWQMAPHPETPEEQASGRGMSDRAIGHTGFTGTSLWIDPARDLISVILTNRVHPTPNLDYASRRARISAMLAKAFPAQ